MFHNEYGLFGCIKCEDADKVVGDCWVVVDGTAAIVSVVSPGVLLAIGVSLLLLLLPEFGPAIIKLFGVGGNCIFDGY